MNARIDSWPILVCVMLRCLRWPHHVHNDTQERNATQCLTSYCELGLSDSMWGIWFRYTCVHQATRCQNCAVNLLLWGGYGFLYIHVLAGSTKLFVCFIFALCFCFLFMLCFLFTYLPVICTSAASHWLCEWSTWTFKHMCLDVGNANDPFYTCVMFQSLSSLRD